MIGEMVEDIVDTFIRAPRGWSPIPLTGNTFFFLLQLTANMYVFSDFSFHILGWRGREQLLTYAVNLYLPVYSTPIFPTYNLNIYHIMLSCCNVLSCFCL